ncbi:MAG: hypothetical protein U0796_04355 [Gemmatales bacterium]
MSEMEANVFLATHGESACVRYNCGPDGRVLTNDCQPAAPVREVSWLRYILFGLISWFGMGLATGCSTQGKPVVKGGMQLESQSEGKADNAPNGAVEEQGIK